MRDLDLSDPQGLVDGAFSQRGPMPGDGRGPGKRWNGTVEDTPALWVTWLADLCRRAGVDPRALSITWGGVPLALTYTDLTFGRRWWWLCPRCARRCEAIYLLRGEYVGCRLCLRLGYRSQKHRQTSAWGTLDLIFSRRWLDGPARWEPEGDPARGLVDTLARAFRERVGAMIDGLTIEKREVIEDGQEQDTD